MNIMGKHIYYRDILAFNLSEPLLSAFLSFSLFPLHLCLLTEGHVVLFKLFPCVLRNKSRQTAHLQYSSKRYFKGHKPSRVSTFTNLCILCVK